LAARGREQGIDTDTVALFLALLTVGAELAVLGSVIALVAARRGSARIAALVATVREQVAPNALGLAAIVALVATAGSLYLSEIADFPPCELCWYQRIAMYPLTIVLAIAARRSDLAVRWYVLPVVAIGASISAYHYQLERFPAQSSLTCSLEVPCTTVWIWKFHYVSIPLMAFSAFALIATLVIVAASAPNAPSTTPSLDLEVVPRDHS
jgi:Disulfide bond formation protein DsbB